MDFPSLATLWVKTRFLVRHHLIRYFFDHQTIQVAVPWLTWSTLPPKIE